MVHGLSLEAALPALAGLIRFTPALMFFRAAGTGVSLAPPKNLGVVVNRTLGNVDKRIDGASVVDLIGRDSRGIGRTRARVSKHLPFQCVAGHTRNDDFRNADVLIADQAGNVFPFWMSWISGWLGRVKCNVAGAACHTDAERRLDGAVAKTTQLGIITFTVTADFTVITFPGSQTAIKFFPCHWIKFWIGKLAET